MSPVSSDLESYTHRGISLLLLAFVSFLCHYHCASMSLSLYCPSSFTVTWVLH